MTCPYLVEVTMAFCGASPFKKLIPVDRLSPDSPCSGDAYLECPIYRELLAREGRGATESEGEPTPRSHQAGGAT
jgi:hypothetical protein